MKVSVKDLVCSELHFWLKLILHDDVEVSKIMKEVSLCKNKYGFYVKHPKITQSEIIFTKDNINEEENVVLAALGILNNVTTQKYELLRYIDDEELKNYDGAETFTEIEWNGCSVVIKDSDTKDDTNLIDKSDTDLELLEELLGSPDFLQDFINATDGNLAIHITEGGIYLLPVYYNVGICYMAYVSYAGKKQRQSAWEFLASLKENFA